MKILVTRTYYDDLATEYSSKWMKQFVDYATSRGNSVIEITDPGETSETVWKVLSENPDIEFIYHLGHGCTHVSTMRNYSGNEDVFWMPPGCGGHTHNDSGGIDLLKNKVAYLLSCSCGQSLVPEIFNSGGKGSVGYYEPFSWVVDTDYGITEDPFARGFFESANELAVGIVDGMSMGDAYNLAISKFNQWAEYWSDWIYDNPNADADILVRAKLCQASLIENRDSLVAFSEDLNNTEYIRQSMKVPILITIGIFASYAVGKFLYDKSKEYKKKQSVYTFIDKSVERVKRKNEERR